MKDNFIFYGISAPKRKNCRMTCWKQRKDFGQCYKDDHRELQYLVYDYLLTLKIMLTMKILRKLKLISSQNHGGTR